MNSIAFFDFDGTITKKDSLLDFIMYAVSRKRLFLGFLTFTPTYIAYKLNLISNSTAKEQLLSIFFKGWDSDDFQKKADIYSLTQIDRITCTKAIDRIKWHQAKKHKVVIVSASMESWLKAWCKRNNLILIATQLEIKNKKLTGKYKNKNCYGIEKRNRILEAFDIRKFDQIFAYGDSKGDEEMLLLAHFMYMNIF